jgi:predicted DNA-binding mobile mystery protein A
MGKKTLQLQQLNNKMLRLASLKEEVVPSTGWIKAIRTSIGMSMQQLGNKLNISKQGVLDIERREKDGSISIKSLREVAHVMDMKLVYGFIPLDGTLDALIEKKAKELAKQIVMRTAHTMQLEDQANSNERIEAAIRERTAAIQNLWD